MRVIQGSLRIGMSAAVLVALIASIIQLSQVEFAFVPADFFGFFTVQSNLLTAFVLAATGVQLIAKRSPSSIMQWVWPLVVTDMVIVGAIYAALLAPWGQPGGPFVPWANMVLHLLSPVFILVDWMLAPDRARVPLKHASVVLLHPLIWCVVTLVRGATDGWVPYPFLDPELGYPVVFAYIGGLSVAFVAVGVGVLGVGMLPPPRSARAPIPARSVPLLGSG